MSDKNEIVLMARAEATCMFVLSERNKVPVVC